MERQNLFRLFFLFHRMNCNPSKNENKYKNTSQKYIKCCHFYSSFIKIVPIQKQAIKIAIPKIKVKKFIDFPINCPKTKPVNVSLPTSYNAFPSSCLWFLSNFILLILPFNLKKVNKGGTDEIYKFAVGVPALGL